jgi:hypothetical protein
MNAVYATLLYYSLFVIVPLLQFHFLFLIYYNNCIYCTLFLALRIQLSNLVFTYRTTAGDQTGETLTVAM